MGILSWIIVGLIAGLLAKFIMPGRDPGGIIVTILIGIVGAIVGGFLVGLVVGGDTISGINITTIVVATLGAILLLAVYRWYAGARRLPLNGRACTHRFVQARNAAFLADSRCSRSPSSWSAHTRQLLTAQGLLDVLEAGRHQWA